jgi:hypothetical protein
MKNTTPLATLLAIISMISAQRIISIKYKYTHRRYPGYPNNANDQFMVLASI